MKKIILVLIIVLILGGALYYLSSNKSNTSAIRTTDISMTASGFSPTSITIHKGDTVKFTNNDSSPHWPASNPHPSHTDYSGFDALRPVPPGTEL